MLRPRINSEGAIRNSVDTIPIALSDAECAQIWFAMNEKIEQYNKDLSSRYDGDPRFGQEDVDFLTSSIRACESVKAKLTGEGYQP